MAQDQTHRIVIGTEGHIDVPQKTIDIMLKRAEEMREERRREAAAPAIGMQDDIFSQWPIDGQDVDLFAGEAYAIARREANWDRRIAFDNMPDFGTPRGTARNFHPEPGYNVFTWGYERERGIPSW